ncbi:MAG: M3 family metallopeptidase [Methanomicrobiales archaeon]
MKPLYSAVYTFVLIFIIILMAGCLQNGPPSGPNVSVSQKETGPIQARYSPGEIARESSAAEQRANASLNAIAALKPGERTVSTTLVAFDSAITDYNDAVAPLNLMGYVYPDPGIAAEGVASEQAANIFLTSTYSRRDLYDAMKGQAPRTSEESRLYTITIRDFEHNGLNLPEDRLASVRAMKENLTGLESQFTANLNNDNTTLEFTAEDLAGIPDSSIATFGTTNRSTYIVTLKYPDYLAVMTYAGNNETRKKMYVADLNRQAERNTALLEEAIVLREQIAKELGYKTWADYQLDGRMAENTTNVMAFLDAMKGPLVEKNRKELAGLLEIRKRYDPASTQVDPWDILYLLEKQRKNLYAYDMDEVREYFPLDGVLQGMFSTYGTLFGIRYDEVKDAPVWSPGVRLFRVSNSSDNATIGYLYLDPYPRDGKYGHFAEYTLRKGRMKEGTYTVPVVAIMGNFHAPEGNTPSLLTPGEMETLFHENGHAVHDLLSRSPYGTLSGTNVEKDFLETPSQTLEEWVWDPQVLESLSGHYTNTSRKLPAGLRDQVIAARDVGIGSYYSSQLAYALEDMRFHSASGPVNTTDVWFRTYAEVKGMKQLAGTHQPATMGHFMGGYDAGYYGYLWSKVYALNIVDVFKRDGMTNQTDGRKFRQEILAKGNMADGNELLVHFLGTKPGVQVLYQRLGITVSPVTGGQG